MKTLSTLIILLTAINIFAQQQSAGADPPDLKIVATSRYLGISESPTDADIFKALRDQNEARGDKDNPERNRTTLSNSVVAPVTSGISSYVYELKVKNTGQKIIRIISWKHAFLAPNGLPQPFIGQTCSARKNIAPGKTEKLIFISRVAPPKMAKNIKDTKKLEKSFIQYVEYADGSTWKANSQ